MTKSVAKGEIRVGETVITFEMPSSLHEKLSQHGMQDVEQYIRYYKHEQTTLC